MNNQNINETNIAIDLRRFKGMKVEKVLMNTFSSTPNAAVLVLSEQKNETYVIKMYSMRWSERYNRYFPTYKIDSFTLPSKMEKDRFDEYLAPKTTLRSLFMKQSV
ncbi:MAG TPA: hypothetical protein VNM45_03165 [Bacillus sp. (in: firmicutes)]|nr:hypothetical protein [Bacillus sp. (in: firmicutes)]